MKIDIKVYKGSEELNRIDDNVDVEVILNNEKRYTATFFTIQNIHSILELYKTTKECCNGLYFWASDMIIVESLNEEVIEKTIQDLIRTQEFYNVFSALSE